MRNSRLFVFLCLISVFGVNLLVLFLAFWFAHSSRVSRSDLRLEIQEQLGVALTNIVDRIILDVGIKRSSPSSSSPSSSSRSLEFVSADIKTYDGMAFVNGRVFYKGDIISPYGVVVSVGKDSLAIYSPVGDKSYIIAPPLPQLVSAEKEEQPKAAGQATADSSAGLPAAGGTPPDSRQG